MKKSNILGILSILTAMLMLLAACTAADPSVPDGSGAPEQTTGFIGKVNVGMCCPCSGSLGFLGPWMANSARVEIDKINAQGGLLGYEINFMFKDDEGVPQNSLNVVREFIEKDSCVMIIGPAFSTNALATKQLINDSKVIQMLPNATGDENLKDAPYTFRTSETDTMRYHSMVTFMKAKNYQNIGLITMNDATGDQFKVMMPELLQNAGLSLAGIETFRADDTDVSAYMLKLKQAGAEVVIIGNGNSTYAARVAVAKETLDWDVLLLGVGGLEGGTYPQLAGEAAAGTVFVVGYRGWQAGVDFDDMPKGYSEHMRAIIDQYGTFDQGNGVLAIQGTTPCGDAVALWAEAVRVAGSFGADEVKAAMESGKVVVASGVSPSGADLIVDAQTHECYSVESLYFYSWELFEDGRWGFVEVN